MPGDIRSPETHLDPLRERHPPSRSAEKSLGAADTSVCATSWLRSISPTIRNPRPTSGVLRISGRRAPPAPPPGSSLARPRIKNLRAVSGEPSAPRPRQPEFFLWPPSCMLCLPCSQGFLQLLGFAGFGLIESCRFLTPVWPQGITAAALTLAILVI